MAEEISSKTNGTVTLNVRLEPAEHTHLPIIANYTDVHVAQGIAHVNFGFLEPALLMEVGKRSQNGDTGPKHIAGSLTARVALPLDALLRLQHQLSQVLSGLNGKRLTSQKS